MRRINSIDKRALRQQLCDRFGGRCAYCTRSIGMRGTIDHYVPQALGGTNARANLRWACIGCNALKADMPPAEWELRIPALLHRPAETRYQRKVRLIQAAIQRHRQAPAVSAAPATAEAL